MNATHIEDLCHSMPQPWAVVGNGATKYKAGHIIDTYPVVVRFNEYVTDGYEEYVGSKTTFRAIGGWIAFTPRDGDVLICPNAPPPTQEKRPHERIKRLKDTGFDIIWPRQAQPWVDICRTTGHGLLYLLNRERVRATVFHMDGLQSGHYWEDDHLHWDGHNGKQDWYEIQKMKYISIYEPNGAQPFDVIC